MSPNATVSAIQSLLRHLLDDPSSPCWIVQDASTQKKDGDSAHVRASKVIEATYTPSGGTQDASTLYLHVHESDHPSSRGESSLRVHVEIKRMVGNNATSWSLAASRLVKPLDGSGFVDWPRELFNAVIDLLGRANALSAACVAMRRLLESRLVELPSAAELEEEPTRDPDSAPLTSDPEKE